MRPRSPAEDTLSGKKRDRTCVVMGAGALGLGFLGPEVGADYHMVYVDIPEKSDLLDHMTRAGEYTFNETGPSARAVTVRDARGICTSDAGAVAQALAGADLVFTAVGEPNLEKVAPTLAAAAAGRDPSRPFRILCCENGIEIARKCRAHVERALGASAGGRLIVGDTVMGRMCKIVSPPEPHVAPIAPGLDWSVCAEPFFGIPVAAPAMAGLDEPGAAFQVMTEAEFAAQEDVKMMAHNGLHAFLAFLGHLRGKRYFCELTGDAEIMGMASAMLLDEAGEAMLRKHGPALDRNFYRNYAPTILRRITCPGLHDEIARGTRGVMRKLEPWERLVGGLRTIAGQGIEPRIYAVGLAGAVLVAQREGETDMALGEVLTRHCELDAQGESDLISLIEDRARWLEEEFGA